MAADQPTVLVVEDEAAQREVLSYNLEAEGFRVARAENGEEALMLLDEEHPDIIVLDWMLPNVSGIEICRQLRQKSETRGMPVIMLTAKGEENDRIRGLETGADDYIVKPFSPAELTARIKAVLRRAHPEQSGEVLSYADIEMDITSHRVTRGGKAIKLGPTEFRLLRSEEAGSTRSGPGRRGRPPSKHRVVAASYSYLPGACTPIFCFLGV